MNLSRYLSFFALPLLAMLAFHSSPVQACSCQPAHPQTHFCRAGFIAVIRVLKKSYKLKPDHVVYKVEIKKTYKMNRVGHELFDHGRISTPKMSSMCGLDLDVGTLYMIAGTGPSLNACTYIKPYLNMTLIERRGFAGGYRKACKCKVKLWLGQPGVKTSQSSNSCKWNPFGCETNHSACLPTAYQTPEGEIFKCDWRRTRAYKQCRADP